MDILRWTWRQFRPDTILTCSFQDDGVVLAHMLQDIAPDVRVVFIDTGFHFPETLAYRDEIVRRLALKHFVELHPVIAREEFARTHGLDLYARDPDLCLPDQQGRAAPPLSPRDPRLDQRTPARPGGHPP